MSDKPKVIQIQGKPDNIVVLTDDGRVLQTNIRNRHMFWEDITPFVKLDVYEWRR